MLHFTRYKHNVNRDANHFQSHVIDFFLINSYRRLIISYTTSLDHIRNKYLLFLLFGYHLSKFLKSNSDNNSMNNASGVGVVRK